MKGDITSSLELVNKLVDTLRDLQEKCARCSDEFEAVLGKIEEDLELKMEANHLNVETYKEKIGNTKCGFWEVLFTLNHCQWTEATKKDLGKIKADF